MDKGPAVEAGGVMTISTSEVDEATRLEASVTEGGVNNIVASLMGRYEGADWFDEAS